MEEKYRGGGEVWQKNRQMTTPNQVLSSSFEFRSIRLSQVERESSQVTCSASERQQKALFADDEKEIFAFTVFGVRRQDFCFVNIYASSWSFGDGFVCLFSLQTVGFEYIIYYVGFLWSNNVTEEGAAVFTDRITTFRGHILWRILYFDLFSLEMARIQATFQKWTWYKIYATSRRGSE